MTNYNERLDEILGQAFYIKDGEYIGSYQEDNPIGFDIKQAITSLIKELVAEAKPHYTSKPNHNFGTTHETGMSEGYNLAIDEFEQNLLKALEEK